jgi:hypothetical protein
VDCTDLQRILVAAWRARRQSFAALTAGNQTSALRHADLAQRLVADAAARRLVWLARVIAGA